MAPTEPMPAASGKTRRKLHPSLAIDMTPMVDLGFLLISFFMFTTTLSEKKGMDLIMPKEGTSMALAESKALTVLLAGEGRVLAYEGRWEDAVQRHRVITGYDAYEGIGKLIRQKQQQLGVKGREGLMLLIKPTAQASYQNVLAALDEATINGVTRYAIVEPAKDESGDPGHGLSFPARKP